MVPKAGFEPARIAPPPPQDGASTNSATWALTLKELLVTYFLQLQVWFLQLVFLLHLQQEHHRP